MRIVDVKKVEDCFDGSRVYRYWFDEPWTEEEILRLRTLGKLDYFPEFPRPFFRVCREDGLQIKGVSGEDSCQAVYPRADQERIKAAFEAAFVGEPSSPQKQVDPKKSYRQRGRQNGSQTGSVL